MNQTIQHYEITQTGVYLVGKTEDGRWVFSWNSFDRFDVNLGTSDWKSLIPYLNECFNRIWFEYGNEDEAKYLMGEFLEFFHNLE